MNNRKRGAQPGNQNAFKHGFYSSTFSQGERGRLGKDKDNLESEIKALRVVAHRVLARLSNGALSPTGSEKLNDDTLHSINTLVAVVTAIATLARSHQLIAGKYLPAETAILDALAELNAIDGIA
jgi:hypothetical protein